MNTSSCVQVAYDAGVGHGVKGRELPPARLDAESAAAVAQTLQALTAPSRLLILARLRESPATVSVLAESTDMEQSAVSHQLRLLRTMGLVAAQRTGRNITYSLYDEHVAELLDQAVYHAEHLRLGYSDRHPAVG
jgi:DNA-binding transcriptional ArsR family regulator